MKGLENQVKIIFILDKMFKCLDKSIIFKFQRRMPNGYQYLIYGQKYQNLLPNKIKYNNLNIMFNL